MLWFSLRDRHELTLRLSSTPLSASVGSCGRGDLHFLDQEVRWSSACGAVEIMLFFLLSNKKRCPTQLKKIILTEGTPYCCCAAAGDKVKETKDRDKGRSNGVFITVLGVHVQICTIKRNLICCGNGACRFILFASCVEGAIDRSFLP